MDFFGIGGLEQVFRKISFEHASLGHEVTALCPSRSKRGEFRIKTLRVKSLKEKRIYSWINFTTERFEKLVAPADIVHVHCQHSPFDVQVARCAKKMGKKVVVSFISLFYPRGHRVFPKKLLGTFYQNIVERSALKYSDCIVTCNVLDSFLAEKLYGVKPILVSYGVDEDFLRKPRNERLVREKHGIRQEFVVSYVGRIHKSKGLHVLIKAFALLDKNRDVALVVAGKGDPSYILRLRRLVRELKIANNVYFLGFIPKNELLSLLDASDVFVFPSLHGGECYALVIDEAYARGVPVIASKIGAIPWRVEDGKTGLLVRPNSPEALASALGRLLEDQEFLQRLRIGVRERAKKLLTWKQVGIKLLELYEQL